MDKETATKIQNLLNHAFNLLECDKDGHQFKELKEMVWNARNLSSWIMKYNNNSLPKWTLRDRDDFLMVMEEILTE